jgi:hypothetical protein
MGESGWQSFSAALQAIGAWWYTLIPGLLCSLLNVFELLRGKKVFIPPRIVLACFVLGLIVAQFLAYMDLRKEILNSKPDFAVALQGSTEEWDKTQNRTVLLILASITNRGADSSIPKYRINFHSSSFDGDCPQVSLPDPFTIDSNGAQYTYTKEQLLPVETQHNVARGQTIGGYIACRLEGDHQSKAAPGGDAVITLTVYDYLGNAFLAMGGGLSSNKLSPGSLPIIPGQVPTVIPH